MISTTIPPELADAAIELNRNYGTIYAWRFLAHKGFRTEHIYLLLKDAVGPETGPPQCNTELWQMIANGGEPGKSELYWDWRKFIQKII
jgi:hypothetical protein